MLFDAGPGDEVIMPSFTFVSTANAFVLRGATPVFVDIRPDTLNLDERLIEAAITPRTKAIVPVHYAGVACEMDAIMAIATAPRPAGHRGRGAGAAVRLHAAAARARSATSAASRFHETKNIISGEGGALLVNDPRFVERAEIIREKGTNRSAVLPRPGRQVHLGRRRLVVPAERTGRRLPARPARTRGGRSRARRRALCERYRDALGPLDAPGLSRCQRRRPKDGRQRAHVLPARRRRSGRARALIEHLKAAGIHAVFHYVPLHASPAGSRFGRGAGPLPVTDEIRDRLLRLPLYYGLAEEEVRRVAAVIRVFFCR